MAMSDLCTESDLLGEFRDLCRKHGQSEVGRRMFVTPSVVSMVLSGQRGMPESIANGMGYARQPAFRKVAKGVFREG